MNPNPPSSLSLLAALDLVRNTKPEDLTAEEIAGVRARLESQPSFFASAGGVAAVERFLAEAEAALAAERAPAKVEVSAPEKQVSDAQAAPKSLRRRVELVCYAVAVLAATGGIIAFVRHGDKGRPVANRHDTTEKEAPNDPKNSAQPVTQPSQPDSQSIESETPPNDDLSYWQGWRVDAGKETAVQQLGEWDHFDPSNPVPAETLHVSGGEVRLTLARRMGPEDKWLMVYVRPVGASLRPGQISVSIDGQQAAKASIGVGQSDWPMYVPLAAPGGGHGKEHGLEAHATKLEISFIPGTPKQQVIFWRAKLVETQTRPPQPESPLIAAMRSDDPAARVQGANAAAQTVDHLALGTLLGLLKDSHRDVRRAAVMTLAKYNADVPDAVVDSLIGKLNDPDPEIRRLAAQSLVAFDTTSTWVALSQAMMKHPDMQLRIHIAQLLAGRQHVVIRAAYEQNLQVADDALRLVTVHSLAHNPDTSVVPLLVRALSDPEPAVRRTAAGFLAGRNDPVAEVAMIEALKNHPDPLVRRTALSRFYQLPTPKALPAIRAAMTSPDDWLKRNVPVALARLMGDEAEALLLELFASADPHLRNSAGEALITRPGARVEEALLRGFAPDSDATQRSFVLRRFDHPPLVTPRLAAGLREAAKSPSAILRFEAVDKLHRLRMGALHAEMQSGKTRQGALDALAAPPWGDTFALMTEMLDDPHWHVRAGAAGSLRGDPHPDADAIMPRLMNNPDAQIRQLAAGRFPRYAIASPKMMDFYKLCLADSDGIVRMCGVMALFQLRLPEAEPLLAAAADDPAFVVREALCRARQIDPNTVREDALLPETAKTPGPQMVPTLIGLLRDPKPSVRHAAALKLSQTPDPVADQAMLEALRSHPDVFVRSLGLQSLHRKPPTPDIIPLVAEALRHPDAEMRGGAVSVLARLPGPEAIPHLAALISDPAANVRLAVAHVLCNHPSPAAEDASAPLLTNPDWRIRQLAVQRFTRAPSPKALAGLREAAAAPEREIRAEAVRALGMLPVPDVIPILAGRLDDPEDSVRNVAAEMLRSRPEPATIDVMLQALTSHPRIDVRIQAAAKFEAQPHPPAAGPLSTAAKHEDDTLRATALRALGRIEGPATTAPLVEALADPIPEVYLTAARLLAARRDDPSEQAMIAALSGHADVEVRRIAATRFHGAPTPKAIPALMAAIKQDDDQLRLLATQALNVVQAPEAIDPLIAALDDPSEAVRQTAFGALSPRPDPRAQAAVAAYKAKMQGVP